MRPDDVRNIKDFGIEVVIDECSQALDNSKCWELKAALQRLTNFVQK